LKITANKNHTNDICIVFIGRDFPDTVLVKKGCFLSFERENKISQLLAPLKKSFWLPLEKFIIAPLWKKIFTTPMCIACAIVQ